MGSELSLPQLPHAYPFRLLDVVLMVEPGHWVVAMKHVSRGDRLVGSDGRLSAVLLAEMMAQASGLAAGETSTPSPAPVVLARIDRFRCRARAGEVGVAGDRLLITVRVVRRFGSAVRVHASVRAGQRRCAGAELVLHLGGAR